MPSISYGPGLCVKQIYRRAARAGRISRWVVEMGACERILQNRQKEFANLARMLAHPSTQPDLSSPTVRFNPRGLHYDGMHNARWVRRRAVCASYIAMPDGRDSEKDFPNGISSPRIAYIFHGRGRANRLPLLSSIFCAPRDMSRLLPRSMWTNGTFRGAWVADRGKLAGKSERKMYILESRAKDIYIRNNIVLREREKERERHYYEKRKLFLWL